MAETASERRVCECAYIGERNSIVDRTGAHTDKVVKHKNVNYSSNYFLANEGVFIDDTNANHKLRGSEGTSLTHDTIDGGKDMHLKEKNAVKQIDGEGGPGTQFASVVVKDSENVTLESKDSQVKVHSGGGKGSLTTERIVEGKSTVTLDEARKKTIVTIKNPDNES